MSVAQAAAIAILLVLLGVTLFAIGDDGER